MRSQISSKHSKPMLSLRLIWGSCCLIFAALLQACAVTSPTCLSALSVQTAAPSLSTPQPAQAYSKQWQQEVGDWQKLVLQSRQKLKATQLMQD